MHFFFNLLKLPVFCPRVVLWDRDVKRLLAEEKNEEINANFILLSGGFIFHASFTYVSVMFYVFICLVLVHYGKSVECP